MEESGYRFGVGVLVLASIVIGMLLVVFFGAVPNFWQKHYTVVISFKSAPGVSTDTPVLKAGVKIGRVANVSLRKYSTTNLNDPEQVDLTLELDSKIEITHGELPRIRTGSLITGDAVVEFIRPTEESLLNRFDGIGAPKNGILDPEENLASQQIMKDGDVLHGGDVAEDPFNAMIKAQGEFERIALSVANASNSVASAGNKFGSFAATLEDIVVTGRGNLAEILNKWKDTSDRINETAGTINRVALQIERSDLPQAVADTITKVPEAIDEVSRVLKQAQDTLKSYEVVGNTANSALMNIKEFTDPFAKEGDHFAQQVIRTLENLDASLIDIRRFSIRLNNSQFATLLDDVEFRDGLRRSVANVENATRELRKLRPIMDNLNVFADKIATDPGGELVKRTLSPRPIGMGSKTTMW